MQSKVDLVRIEGLSHSFSGVPALADVSLTFARGQIHALLGANGAGKSTLVRAISGSMEPTAGKIVVEGQEYESLTPRLAHEVGIRTIHQEFTLVPQLTAAENIFLGREPNRFGWLRRREMRSAALEVLSSIDAHVNPDDVVSHLSIAQQQQVEIAKAVAGGGSRLLIMDEPTSGLTQREADSLFELVCILRARGAGVVFISHRIDEVLALADVASVLRDGELVGTVEVSRTDRESLARMIIGTERVFRLVERTKPPPTHTVRSADVLSIDDVSNEYLKHISLSVRRGEILGVFGLVGSGRTRLARMLFGIDPARTGTIRSRGHEIAIRSPGEAISHGIGLVPEDRKQSALVMAMGALPNASLAALGQFSIGGIWTRRSQELAAYASVRERLDIKSVSPFSPVRTLSGGNQQKVCFARWLLRDCEILVLDEPTRGVDIGAKGDIYEEIFRLAAEGRTLIVMSSEAQEITAITNRALVMQDGWIKEEISIDPGDEARLLLAAGSKALS